MYLAVLSPRHEEGGNLPDAGPSTISSLPSEIEDQEFWTSPTWDQGRGRREYRRRGGHGLVV
jgi:hypothetical protein